VKLLWLINRHNDPNYGDIGICKAISGFLIDNGYQIRNFDFVGRKFWFQFTRTIYIFAQFFVMREKPALLVIGGGQLLLNNRSFPYAMLGWYLVSKISGVPLLAFSVGTERNSKASFFYSLVLKLFLGHAEQVYLRDLESRDTVYQLTGLHFDTVPDAVYLTYGNTFLSNTNKSAQSVVFVSKESISNHAIDHYCDLVVDALKHVENNTNVIISASSEQDFKSAQIFYDYTHKLGLNYDIEIAQNFDQFLKQIANANIVISSRMHPLIYSHLMGKPFIAIPTNQKTKSMASFLMNNSATFLALDVKKKLLSILKK
jgi:polysaccharide pyruvyl transferase WcaK-like protein